MAFRALPQTNASRLLALLLSVAILVGLCAAASAAAKPAGHGKARASAGYRLGVAQGTRVKARCSNGKLMRRQRPRRAGRKARPAWRCAKKARASTLPSTPLYWGASIGDQLTGEQAPWDMGAVAKFEGMAGKPLSLINFFSPFADCSSSQCSFYDFPTKPMENIRRHGAIPVFSWSSQSTPSGLNQPDFQLSDVISGAHDSYIREFAEDVRDWGHPFFLRFNWEMNGNWFSWSEGVNGNQPGEYVAAWRHVHDIFSSVGATNATWVWCPNIDPYGKMQDLASLYPGDEYVDWTGLDGYNWGPKQGDVWTSFDKLYSSTYHRITDAIAPSKPLLISEVGSSETGGSKAEWISDMLGKIPTAYPKVGGMLWFETLWDGMDWPLESSATATSSFASGIQDPAYRGNDYAALSATPIPPPS